MKDEELDGLLLRVGKSWREQDCPEPPPLTHFLKAAGVPSAAAAHLDLPAAGRLFPTGGPTRSRGWAAALAAAAAVAVTVAVAVPVVWRRSIDGAPVPARSAGAGGFVQHDRNYRVALAAVEALLAKVTVPPGSKPVSAAPVDALKDPAVNYSALGRIHQTRWWTIGMRYTETLAYFTANPPTGLVRSGSQRSGNSGHPISEGLNFVSSEMNPAYSPLTLIITVAPLGSAAGFAVTADTRWTPTRPPAEHIASPVSSVDVTATRSTTGDAMKTTSRTVTGHDAQRLANIVNRLPMAQPGPSTGLGGPDWQDRLTFHTATSDVVATAGHSTNTVTFTVGHVNMPALSGAAIIHQAIDEILGISP